MESKYSIKRTAMIVGILALLSVTAVAQENRSEISVQGTGFFTKDTAGNAVFERANDDSLGSRLKRSPAKFPRIPNMKKVRLPCKIGPT